MTDRMTYREENRSMESPHSAPLTELLGKDSIPDYRDILPDQPGADDSSNQPAEALNASCFPASSWKACGDVWGSGIWPSSPPSG